MEATAKKLPKREGHSELSLAATNVTVAFGGILALSEVDFELHRCEIVGLIGPNGAGKTTMVNVLTGFQRPTRGDVCLGGLSLSGLKPHQVAAKGIGRTFQAGRLFRRLTVLENLEVSGFSAGKTKAQSLENAEEILDWLDISDLGHRMAGSLAYGDERRVGIARALALQPSFLLMDEPASGMNERECEALVKCVLEVPQRFDCGVLIIEHNMKVVMNLCDRIQVLDGGRRIAMSTPGEVMGDPRVRAAYLGHGGSDRTMSRMEPR